jgi:hypothetical protein
MMSEKRYTIAGYLSIALAVFLPLMFALGLAQTFIGKHMMGIADPGLTLEDLSTVLTAAVLIFVLLVLRKLLNDRYGYSRADRPITAAIIWYVLFTIGSFLMIFFADTTWPAPDERSLIAMLSFWILSMTSAGIIEIFLGLRLLQIKEKRNELMKVFAYVTLIMGVLELTVVLSPLALVLMPVWCVNAAMVFLREKDEEQIL